jgi:3-oxoacyl-[acyl-carrier protein] reductase
MNDLSVKEKIVIVTGASRGIGLAVSRLLAEKGAHVALVARDQKALEEACHLIKTGGGDAISIPIDIRQESEVDTLIFQVMEYYGRIDILINNAGVLTYGPVVSAKVEDWNRVIDTNLKGAFFCSREVLPIMIRQGSGMIINMASGAGETGFPNLAIYCASKFGLIGFSKALAKEVAPYNIKIAYLCPGYVDTEMLNNFPEDFLKNVTPLRPDEVADQLLQLILYPDLSEKRNGFLKTTIKKGVQWMTSKKSD